MNTIPDLISTAEAAELIGKSVWTIGRWAKSDTHPLTPVYRGKGPRGEMLFRRADVEALMVEATPVK